MKRKGLVILLAVEGAVCLLVCLLRQPLSGVFSAALAFPFEQIGMGLRALSLSGSFGNVAAFAIYVAVSLVPVGALPLIGKKRRLVLDDGLLAVLSLLLFVVLYYMINPGLIGLEAFGGALMADMGKALLGGAVYSVLFGYGVLRVLRLFFAGTTAKLQKYMGIMLCLLNVLFVYLIFGASFGTMLESMQSLAANNTGNPLPLGPSYLFLALQFAVDALPYALNVLVVFYAFRLLEELDRDRYCQETVAQAHKLSRLCAVALGVTVVSNIAFNLLQLLFAKYLAVINGVLQIPLLSIALVLAALLLSRFVAENKRLKDDNDMFI